MSNAIIYIETDCDNSVLRKDLLDKFSNDRDFPKETVFNKCSFYYRPYYTKTDVIFKLEIFQNQYLDYNFKLLYFWDDDNEDKYQWYLQNSNPFLIFNEDLILIRKIKLSDNEDQQETLMPGCNSRRCCSPVQDTKMPEIQITATEIATVSDPFDSRFLTAGLTTGTATNGDVEQLLKYKKEVIELRKTIDTFEIESTIIKDKARLEIDVALRAQEYDHKIAIAEINRDTNLQMAKNENSLKIGRILSVTIPTAIALSIIGICFT